MMVFLDLDSPIGTLRLVGVEDALAAVHFKPAPRAVLAGLGWREARGEPMLLQAASQLREYFAGTRRTFELELALDGSPFQKQVWAALRAIPFGATVSYGDIARSVGDPDSARAVGMANNRNPIPIIVPCHRVINADGSLGGFGGGMETKQWLLRHEGAAAGAQQSLPW